MNYVEHLLILASSFTGCFSISDSASVVRIPMELLIMNYSAAE